jgi:hypothetical protein
MDLMPILSTIILIATIITLIIAVSAYVVFRLKERQTNKQSVSSAALPPIAIPIVTQPVVEQSQQRASEEDRICRICEDPTNVKKSCPFRTVFGVCFLEKAPEQQPDEIVVNNPGLKFRIDRPPTSVDQEVMWK